MKIRYKVLAGFLVFVLVSLSYMGVTHATTLDDAQGYRYELEEQKAEIEEKIAKLEEEKGNIIEYIEKLDKELNKLTLEMEELTTQIEKANKELAATKLELEEAKEIVNSQYVTMKKRIKYMYENGNNEYVDVILQAESISSLLNRAEYIASITEYDKKLLEDYKKSKDLVAQKEKEQEEKLLNLSNLNDNLELEKQTVTTLVENKQAELTKYDESIAESQTIVEQYNEEIEAQEQLIEDLLERERERTEKERNGDGKDDYSQETGQLRWPLRVGGTITSYFGYRKAPKAGASTYHRGIDIGVPTGTVIVASGAGTVVTASYSSSAGNYIMLSHGNSIYTVYMHCSKIDVTVGDNVEKGELIGFVGSTGVSTGPHLHFGVSIKGTYVDPLEVISR